MSRRIAFGIGLVGALGSLAIFTSIFDPFAAAKVFVISIGAAILFGYGFLDLAQRRYQESFKWKKYIVIWAAFFICLFFARTLSTNDVHGALFGVVGRQSGFISYFAYFLIFVLAVFYVSTSNFKILQKFLLSAGFIAGFYSMLEKLGADPWTMSKIYNGTSGLLGNPNFSGAFLALSAVVSLWFLISKESNPLKIFSGFNFALSIYGVYTSKALQGIISIVLGITVIVLMKLFSANRKFGYLGLAVSLITGFGGILGSLQIGPLSGFFYKTSVSERGDMWRTAMSMIKDHPLWGVGIERYGFYFRQYRDLKQALRAGPDVFSDNAHNVVLHLTATGGIFLGLLYLILNVVIFVVAIRGIISTRGLQRDSLTIALALWLPIQAQNSISVDNPGVFVWSWILGGSVVALAFEKEGAEVGKYQGKKKEKTPSLNSVHPLSPLIALVCVLVTLGVTVKPLIAQKSFAFAFYLGVDPKIPETITNKEAALIKAENQDPGNFTWPRYSANSLFIDKAWKQTIAAANRAVTKDPEDWISWWFMASAYEQSGDRVSAIPARTRTVLLDPWNTSVLLELAKDQLAAGDKLGFEKSKEAILRINPNGADAKSVSTL